MSTPLPARDFVSPSYNHLQAAFPLVETPSVLARTLFFIPFPSIYIEQGCGSCVHSQSAAGLIFFARCRSSYQFVSFT